MSSFRKPSEISSRESRNKINGVVVGVVTNNQDPDGKYRVKVKFPHLPNSMADDEHQDESWWYRVATIMAGDRQGFFCLPEVNDEVLVAFEHGDIARGYIVGALWSAVPPSKNRDEDAPVDRPIFNSTKACGSAKCSSPDDCGVAAAHTHQKPEPGSLVGKHDGKKNDLRLLRSRSGHQLAFNDNSKEARVVLHSGKGHRIVLDDKEKAAVEIYDAKEENFVRIDTSGRDGFNIDVQATTGSIRIKAKQKIRLEAETIEAVSTKNTSIDCDNFSMSAKSTAKLEASAQMDVKGHPININ